MGICMILSCIIFYFYKRNNDRKIRRMHLSGLDNYGLHHTKSTSVGSTPITNSPLPMNHITQRVSSVSPVSSPEFDSPGSLPIPPIKPLPNAGFTTSDDFDFITTNEGKQIQIHERQDTVPELPPTPNKLGIGSLLSVTIPNDADNVYHGVMASNSSLNSLEMTPVRSASADEETNGGGQDDSDEAMYDNCKDNEDEGMYSDPEMNVNMVGNTPMTPQGTNQGF